MKILIKILVALAAIAGAVYVAATYGDRIVAWAKKLLNACSCCCCDGECCCEEEESDDVTVEVVEAEVAPETVATEGDFEG